MTESYQREPAPEDFDIAIGHVAKGTLAVLQFESAESSTATRRSSSSTSPGYARSAARLAEPAAGDGSYRVEITGEPSYAVDIIPSSRYGDHNAAAIAGEPVTSSTPSPR